MDDVTEQERARRRTAGAALLVLGVLMVAGHFALSHAHGSPLHKPAFIIFLVVVGLPLALAGALVWRSGRGTA